VDRTKRVNPSVLGKVARRTLTLLHHQGMVVRSVIVDKVDEVRNWIAELIMPREELGNHSICPFAATSSFLIRETTIGGVSPISGVDVAIFIVEENVTIDHLIDRCRILNEMYPDYIFLDDHKDDPSYINGIQSNYGIDNLILVQKKDKLLTARKNLKKTDYYTYWSEEFYKKIVEG
jgi:hypothetical protein